jgi:hypothetical protein
MERGLARSMRRGDRPGAVRRRQLHRAGNRCGFENRGARGLANDNTPLSAADTFVVEPLPLSGSAHRMSGRSADGAALRNVSGITPLETQPAGRP